MSRSEGAICARRGIDDRVTVVRDVQRVIDRHGAVGAGDQLSVGAGYLAKVIDRKAEITRELLWAMYGPSGDVVLLRGLAVTPGIEADVAKVMAVAGARPKAASVVTVIEGGAAVDKLAPVEPAPAPSKPPPWRRERPAPDDAGHLMLVATLKRACDVLGSNRQAAEYFGWGLSTLGFLKAGSRAFSPAQAERVRAWAAANPEQDAAADADTSAGDRGAARLPPPALDASSVPAPAPVDDDRGAEEVPPPAPVSPDTATIAAGGASPPCPAGMTVVAVAAAPAEPPFPDVALPPTVLGDPVAAARAKLINEIADLENREIAATIERLDLLKRADHLQQRIDAAMARLPVLRQAVAALDAVAA